MAWGLPWKALCWRASTLSKASLFQFLGLNSTVLLARIIWFFRAAIRIFHAFGAFWHGYSRSLGTISTIRNLASGTPQPAVRVKDSALGKVAMF